QADRARPAADLLHGDAVFEIAQARPAVLLLNRDAEQPHLAELRPQTARELVGLVDLGGERRDLVGGKSAHAGAQLVGRLAEIEVERWEVVGDQEIGSPLTLRLASVRRYRGHGPIRPRVGALQMESARL